MGAFFNILRFICLLSVGWNRMLKILHVHEYINTGGKSSNIGGGHPPVPTPLYVLIYKIFLYISYFASCYTMIYLSCGSMWSSCDLHPSFLSQLAMYWPSYHLMFLPSMICRVTNQSVMSRHYIFASCRQTLSFRGSVHSLPLVLPLFSK